MVKIARTLPMAHSSIGIDHYFMSTVQIYKLDYLRDSFDVFRRIQGYEFPVILESGRGRYTDLMGRFDILSAEPHRVIQSSDSCQGNQLLDQLNQSLEEINVSEESLHERHQHLPFIGGAIGFLNYDFGRQLETLPSNAEEDISLPSAWFGIYGWALITDHLQQESWLIYDPELTRFNSSDLMDILEFGPEQTRESFTLSSPFKSNLTHDQYLERFGQLQEYIKSGDCYQVNFAQRFSAECQGDSFDAFDKISRKIPTPFSAFFQLGQWDVISHSPERFLELEGTSDHQKVTTKPIKGTRARGHDENSDEQLKNELASSTKDRAENLMIVDLLRNDLSRVCAPFSVKVPKLFEIESYPNVHHLVSTVTGELADGQSATSLLAHSFPGGSITGAPKIRAMEIIDELEPHHRSLYCGSVVYISRHGRMDSSITIRTLVRDQNTIHAWGGGGIVADSEAEAEYQETLTKITPLLRAIDKN